METSRSPSLSVEKIGITKFVLRNQVSDTNWSAN